MKEVTIEAVKNKTTSCEGCIMYSRGVECSFNVEDSGLPYCGKGYIYKIKEK